MPAALPDRLTLETREGTEALQLVGPSLWGLIYRAGQTPDYYRVLQPEEAPVAVLSEAARWIGKPASAGVASILDVRHSLEAGRTVVFIRYGAADGPSAVEALARGTVEARLRIVARAAAALPAWWRGTGRSVQPMPADIVLPEHGGATLLPAPFRPDAEVDAVLACPVRARYLSPERVRHAPMASEDADDLFAIGVMWAEVFVQVADLDPPETLLRAANRSLFSDDIASGVVAPWMERVHAIQESRAEAIRFVRAPPEDRVVDPDDLASRLNAWAAASDPVRAVAALHTSGKPDMAFDLLAEILRYQESYDLLLEAARLADALRRPVDGIGYLERAIALRKDRRDVYERQLALFRQLEETTMPFGADRGGQRPELVERLESIMWRDYAEVPKDTRSKYDGIISRFLLDRFRFRQAAEFIFPRLRDESGKHLWWKLDLHLDYAEALTGLGVLPEAKATLLSSKDALQRVKPSGTFTADEIHRVGRRLAELEVRLALLRHEPGARGRVES